jgi:hypothetical protein
MLSAGEVAGGLSGAPRAGVAGIPVRATVLVEALAWVPEGGTAEVPRVASASCAAAEAQCIKAAANKNRISAPRALHAARVAQAPLAARSFAEVHGGKT